MQGMCIITGTTHQHLKIVKMKIILYSSTGFIVFPILRHQPGQQFLAIGSLTSSTSSVALVKPASHLASRHPGAECIDTSKLTTARTKLLK